MGATGVTGAGVGAETRGLGNPTGILLKSISGSNTYFLPQADTLLMPKLAAIAAARKPL